MLSGDELKAAQLHTVNKKPNKIELPDFSKIKELLKGIVIFEGMLKQTPKNEAIEKFKQDVELENFAKIAINIKTKNPDKYNRVCPLCEQEISAIGLWENLEKHFNQEYHQFIERLKKAKEFFAVASRELIEFRNWLNRNFISENLIYDREAINIDQLRQDYLGSIEFVEDSIGVACNALDDKMKAPNESGILLDIDKENLKKHFTKITSDEIKETVDLHNKQQLQYEAIIKQNIEKIQQHFIAKNRANFLAIQNDININQNRIKKYTLYSSCCKKKIDELDSKMKELDASFKSLNEDLHKYFNLQEIRFEKISDSHYKTQRKDCKGNWFDCKSGLSEGEKTIISVIYFVNHCFSVLGQQQKAYPIFILDDPITSLDDNKRDLIKNYIVQKIIGSKERQIFILSHDKDFLARIRKELHSQYRNDMKFFEIIKKDKLQSSFKILEKLKSEKELREFYNRLKEGIDKNEMLQEDDLRKFLEGLMAIIFENYSNFTDGYKRLLECLGIEEKYSSSDIQKLNHNLDDRGYSADELRDKARFVVQIFEKMIEKIQAKNFIVSS